VIAAGGVRSPDDVDALARAGAEAAVVGRALFAR
jgi:phosphoribosylformimino-5-aminoimidazole carboxamide ribonucleotide (ProFAR) isomerase